MKKDQGTEIAAWAIWPISAAVAFGPSWQVPAVAAVAGFLVWLWRWSAVRDAERDEWDQARSRRVAWQQQQQNRRRAVAARPKTRRAVPR